MKAKKILIAEDDPVMRRILTHTVESAGHIAFGCANGEIALQLLRTNSDIDLLITDVAMPLMDGNRLVRIIRDSETLQDLPIIIISSVVSAKQIQHLLDLGVSRFLPKPVKVGFLKDYIDQLLEEKVAVRVG